MKKLMFLSAVVLFSGFALGQSSDQSSSSQSSGGHEVVDASTAKFMALPGLPDCTKGAVLHGDPHQGNFVILLKGSAGCTIPWHWHTATEQVGVVSGSFSLAAAKGEQPKTLRAGSYANLPGKSAHQAKCVTACSLFVAADQPFDIHYVDESGNEIPAEQALKSSGKSAGAKKGAAKKDDAQKEKKSDKR